MDNASIAELAHIIPASANGPRGEQSVSLEASARAQVENILVLCPTCHTVIDKDPSSFPADELRRWKLESQNQRAAAFGVPRVSDRAAARALVAPLFAENRSVHDRFAPSGRDHDDVRADQWARNMVGTIIPNSERIRAVVDANYQLMTTEERSLAADFALHLRDLRARHVDGDWTAGATRFPVGFDSVYDTDHEEIGLKQ
ncbi:hypothetical protein LGT39_01330 [Demequina sp. TTPB684]|uniref:HNH endonuclease n=1 Tax=unclassified Demequina TaxID=2620311 RepID=UPI001CF45FA5|nr:MULTISPECIES: HNH endonuclease [unclassified Demequina]MCB2411489.1 hypothetical protein [Demequina sp. TTPB684]UPU88102.1 hypothetical protein LGT36_012765 [Demequina sp. TMPB413]